LLLLKLENIKDAIFLMNKQINLNDPKLWKNIDWDEPQVPDLLKKSDATVNRSRSAFFKKDNPEFGATMSEVAQIRNQNPEYQTNLKRGCQERDNTYQAISNAKPEVQAKISASLTGKEKTAEHNAKVATKNKERGIPCITPLGIFRTGALAGLAYNEHRGSTNGKNAVNKALKTGKEGYRYITLEEYIFLIGKDI
jgi:hypothetical protein